MSKFKFINEEANRSNNDEINRNYYFTGKVVNAEVIELKGGNKMFKFVLNKDQVLTMECPTLKKPCSDNLAKELFQQSERQGWSIYHLVGKYMTFDLWEKKYRGHYILRIISLNAINDFKEMLDKSLNKPFTTPINMYWILRGNRYNINENKSITLKKPYHNLEIITKGKLNICYPGNLTDKQLNFKNINDIYEKFYKGKAIGTYDRNADSKYYLSEVAICVEKRQYHRRHARVERVINSIALSIGQTLTDEQLNYLKSKENLSQ